MVNFFEWQRSYFADLYILRITKIDLRIFGHYNEELVFIETDILVVALQSSQTYSICVRFILFSFHFLVFEMRHTFFSSLYPQIKLEIASYVAIHSLRTNLTFSS